MKICGIYKVTSPNGNIYIGQSRDIKSRFSSYKRINDCHKVQRRLYYSLKKYGNESHNFEIIKECEIKELNDWEIYYIKFYNTFNTEHGLNLTSGGNFHFEMSSETKLKISERMKKQKLTPEHIQALIKGIKNKPYKPLSKEHKEKLSKSLTGRKMPISHSNRLILRNTGRIVSEKTRQKTSMKLHGIKTGNRRKFAFICKISLDGFLLDVYESQSKAAINNNISKSAINHCINKLSKTSGGYIWK